MKVNGENIGELNVGENQIYKTIQDAINHSSPGDTIFVHPGIYTQPIIIPHSLNIIGTDQNTTIIRSTTPGNKVVINAPWVNISEMSISGAIFGYDESLIKINNSNNITLQKCNIYTEWNYAIRINNSNDIQISNCDILYNFVGVLIRSSYNITLTNNSFTDSQYCIGVINSSAINITRNYLFENWKTGIYTVDSNNITISQNYVVYHETGVYFNNTLDSVIKDNEIAYNEYGIDLNHSMNMQIISNNISLNGQNPFHYFTELGIGLRIRNCTNNSIIGNNILENDVGLHIEHSNGNFVSENEIQYNYYIAAMNIIYSINNTIIKNNITNNEIGINIIFSNDNLITQNLIFLNQFGIDLVSSKNNSISDNVFRNSCCNCQYKRADFNKLTNNTIGVWYGSIRIIESEGNYIYGNICNYSSPFNFAESFCSNYQYFDSNIILKDTRSISIINNSFNDLGLRIIGDQPVNWDSHIIENNTIDTKPICYLANEYSGVVPEGVGQIILANCSNIIIKDQFIYNVSKGIILGFSNENVILNTTIKSPDECGILLHYSDNNSILNNNISDWNYTWNNFEHIKLVNSKGNIIRGNHLHTNWDKIYGSGIILRDSIKTMITGNDIINCSIKIEGDEVQYWNTHNITKSNKINGYQVLYLKDKDGTVVDGEYQYIILANSKNIQIGNFEKRNKITNIQLGFSDSNSIINNEISNEYHGILLKHSKFNTIKNNEIYDNFIGIKLKESHGNSIFNNTIIRNYIGIEGIFIGNNSISSNKILNNTIEGLTLDTSNDNFITNNSISTNYHSGLSITSSKRNSIENNSIHENSDGLKISNSSYNRIVNNTFFKNQNSGFEVSWPSYSNYIYHNNFIDNYEQITGTPGITDRFDNGYPSGGNYFCDYEGKDRFSGKDQNVPGADWIGDTPYKYNDQGSVIVSNFPLLIPMTSQIPSTVPPLPPINIKAKPGPGYVLLTWEEPSFKGGSEILGYRVYKKNYSDKDWEIIYIEKSDHYNDTNVTGGVAQSYMLSAINEAGWGIISTEISAIPMEKEQPFNDEDQNNEQFNVRYILLAVILLSIMVFLIISIRSKKKVMKAQKQKKKAKKIKDDDPDKPKDETKLI